MPTRAVTSLALLALVATARADDLPLLPQPAAIAPWNVASLERLDANADGLMDVVVAGSSASQLALMLSEAPLTLGAPIALNLGGSFNPTAQAVGDFDGDGDTDIASVTAAHLSLLKCNGAGGFASGIGTSLPANTTAVGLAAGDADGDGDLDLLVGSTTGSFAGLNNGGAQFAYGVKLVTGSNSVIRPGDLNGDGLLDYACNSTGSIRTVRGTGGGAFAISIVYAAAGVGEFELARLNGDGLLDLAWIGSDGVFTRLGLPGGDFAGGVPVAGPSNMVPGDLDAGDLDGDGDDDLALVSGSVATVWVAHSVEGVATVGPEDTLEVARSCFDVLVADADGDGWADVGLACSPRTVSLLRGRAAAGFEVPAMSAMPADSGPEAAAGDFDLDGRIDLVVSRENMARVQPGLGGGLFGDNVDSVIESSAGNWWPRVCADFDGDGLPDVAGTTTTGDIPFPHGVRLLLGHGDLTLDDLPKVATSGLARGLCAADFDLDGALDLAGASQTKVHVFHGNGTGGFSVTDLASAGQPKTAAAGDVDGDGDVDLVDVSVTVNSAEVRLNTAGTFAAPVLQHVTNARNVALGDVDGDGLADMAIGSERVSEVSIDLTVLHSTGSGWIVMATAAGGYGTTGENRAVSVRDATGDGLADVLSHSSGSQTLMILRADGAGGMLPGRRFLAHIGEALGLDANGDGREDLAVVADTSGETGMVPDAIRVSLAHGAETWTALGHALPGAGGAPVLQGTGEPVAGAQVAMDLGNALPSAPVLLVAGLDTLMLPWKSGVLVPAPDFVVTLVTDAAGALHLAMAWPGDVPPGTELFLQAWVQDASGPSGFTASNGLRVVGH